MRVSSEKTLFPQKYFQDLMQTTVGEDMPDFCPIPSTSHSQPCQTNTQQETAMLAMRKMQLASTQLPNLDEVFHFLGRLLSMLHGIFS